MIYNLEDKVFICDYCGKQYVRKKYNKKAKNNFCCRECSDKYRVEVRATRGTLSTVSNTICAMCGKPIHKSPSALKENNFCSRTCQNHFLGNKAKKDKDFNCTCTYCGKPFHRKSSHIGKVKNFCSNRCYEEYRKSRLVTKKCLTCGKEFTVTQSDKDTAKYCSTECQIKYQRRFFLETECAYCGKPIVKKKNRQTCNKTGLYFCSNKCIGKYFRGKNSPTYKGTGTVLSVLRSYYEIHQKGKCFARYNKECQICGAEAEHVHHIEPLSMIVENYVKTKEVNIDNLHKYEIAQDIIKSSNLFLDEGNLIPLCKECHKKQHKKGKVNMNITNIEYGMSDNSYNIFLSGCKGNPKCEGCCNPENWSFERGENWLRYINKIKEDLTEQTALIKRIIIVGGEPLDQDLTSLEQLIDVLKVHNIPIYLFTRYDLKDVPEFIKAKCEFIKCGEYKPEFKCESNIQYGIKLATSNQIIYKKGVDY